MKRLIGIRAIHQRNIQTAVLEAKRNGFGILEIHLSSPQFLPQRYDPTDLKKVKVFAKKNNVILQTHSEIGQSLIQADAILRKAEKQKLKQIVQFSRRIGARCLTLHIGDAPAYHFGIGKSIPNDVLYTDYYAELFRDSMKFITVIASKDLPVCIENDRLIPKYQNLLNGFLKTNKIFLTWDLMKTLRKDQWKFFKKNIQYVRNIHVSSAGHDSLRGHEKDFTLFFNFLQAESIPMVIEIIPLKKAIETKNIIRKAGL